MGIAKLSSNRLSGNSTDPWQDWNAEKSLCLLACTSLPVHPVASVGACYFALCSASSAGDITCNAVPCVEPIQDGGALLSKFC